MRHEFPAFLTNWLKPILKIMSSQRLQRKYTGSATLFTFSTTLYSPRGSQPISAETRELIEKLLKEQLALAGIARVT